MKSRSALTLLACLLLAGCPDGDKGDETDTDDSTAEVGGSDSTAEVGDSDPTGSGDPACACIDPERSHGGSYICGEPPCGVVVLNCGDMTGNDPVCGGLAGVTEFDEEALDCSLDMLIARTPGLVEHRTLTYISSAGGFLEVTTGLSRRYSTVDLGGNEGPAGFVTVKEPAYFEGCKAEADVAARFECFKNWAVEDMPTAQCDDPMEYSSQI